ncbi:MAG: RodZ domain-containing protein [Bacillota bacterium]
MLRELGQELRAAREKRGVTIADVQAETKIRSRYLEAIEQGKFDILPGDVYTRGFLKTYAEFLGLDGHAMVERYKQWQAEQEGAASSQAFPGGAAGTAVPAPPGRTHAGPPPDKLRVPGGGSTTRRRGRDGLWAGLALLLVVSLAAGGWLAWRGGQQQGGQMTTPPQQTGPAQTGGTGGSAPPSPGTGQNQAPPETPAITLEAGAVTDQYVIPFTVRASAGTALQLTLTTREGCWIQLQRPGQPTVEETVPAGATRTWEFTGEARLKMGNPPAARLQVSGVAVPDPTATYPVTYVFTQAQ